MRRKLNSRRARPLLQTLEDRTTPTTFTVTSTEDAGAGSLREAVGFANTLGGADVIDFKAGLGSIVLTTGELSITQALTIQGPGAAALSISGNNASRIFNINAALAGTAFDFTGLTLTNGKVSGGLRGGAILFADENLTLTDCVLTGNTATANDGGAIAISNINGSLTLVRCVVSGNSANGSGGGIYIASPVSFSIVDSTVSANTSGGSGGGLFLFGSAGAGGFLIRNSTFSGNVAATSGGGMAWLNGSSPFVVQNSTITNNTATSSSGGGISRTGGTASISLESTIVADNTSTLNANEDLFTTGTVTANFCAVGTKTGVTTFVADVTTNNLLGADLKLGVLASNGGLTQTHLPASDSPILGKGSNPAPALTTDQRGAPFVRSFGVGVDIGAVEVQNAFVVTNAKDGGSGSLREAVAAANANPGADNITFDAALFATPQTIALTTGQIAIGQAVTIAGTGASLVTISGNNSSRIFNAGSAPTAAAISMSNLTLTGGSSFSSGGAISVNDENLTMSRCTLSGNTSTGTGGGAGGAVDSLSGNLTFDNCTFTNNMSSRGGAINLSGYGNLTMTGCTVSGNTATTAAGGISFGGAVITIRNSTVSGNSAGGGGGLYLEPVMTGNPLIRNSTFTLNKANFGGGILRGAGTAAIFVESSIISGNTSPNGPDVFTAGAVNTTASLFGSTSGITTFNADATTLALIGKDAKLGPLQDNGGPTFTHLPALDSPAVSQGLNPAPPVTFDQRGSGFPRLRGPGIDIGAVEARTLLVVTNTNDAGAGSLRQAITDANALSGLDTILFDATAFASPQSVKLLTALPTLNESADFIGTSATNVTVTRAAAASAFRIFSCNAADVGTFSFTNMTIAGGSVASSGGGIFASNDNVTLTGCVLANNTATGLNDGGGLAAGFAGGTITIVDSTISANSARRGAGVYFLSGGTLVMDDSTVSGNQSNNAFGGLGGAGLYNAGNSAVIRNSTFSGNSEVTGRGGGLTVNNAANVTLLNCTVTDNAAGSTGGGFHREAGTLTIESTAVAGNKAATSGKDVQGAFSANFSLIGIANDGAVITGANNKTGTLAVPLNPLLGLLENNGGPTLTHQPKPGSPLLNVGSNPAALASDQRGLTRSVGLTDIGAVEDQTSAPSVTGFTVNGGAAQRSRLTTIQVNFAAPVDAAALQGVGAISLTRTAATASGTVGTIVDTSNGLLVGPASGMVSNVTLTFANVVNPGVQSGSLADGRWQMKIPSANYTSTLNDPNLRRLYGDSNNDGTVDGSDFADFGAAFGSSVSNSPFDFNADGTVDAVDFGEFGNRFGVTL